MTKKTTKKPTVELELIEPTVLDADFDGKKEKDFFKKGEAVIGKITGETKTHFTVESGNGGTYYIPKNKVKQNKGFGGFIIGAAVGGYVGYKIGRAKPKKTGFETEKKVAESAKKAAKKVVKKVQKKKDGGTAEDEGVYIEYLDKDNGFKKTKKSFKSYEEATEWGKKNLDNFNSDMINYVLKNGGTIKLGEYSESIGHEATVSNHGTYWHEMIKDSEEKIKKIGKALDKESKELKSKLKAEIIELKKNFGGSKGYDSWVKNYDEKAELPFEKGGNITGKFFEGELSFLNW